MDNTPTEILAEILQHTLTLDCLLYPAHSSSADSPWCKNLQVKKTILLVCRRWRREIGLPFLYEDITIFEVGGLIALSKTVEENPQHVGSLVRALRLHCYIPRPFYELAKRRLVALFRSCPNIRCISYDFRFGACPTIRRRRTPQQGGFDGKDIVEFSLPSGVKEVFWGSPQSYYTQGRSDALHRLLSPICHNLTTLSIRLREHTSPSHTELHLPLVDTFILDLKPQSFYLGLLTYVCNNFTLPSLKNLTLDMYSTIYESSGGPNAITACAHFCQRHMQTIKTLRIYFHSYARMISRFDLKEIVVACPSITYLGLLSASARNLMHPTITKLDLWHIPGDFIRNFVDGKNLPDYNWNCPALEFVRTFTWPLLRFRSLPECIPWSVDTLPTSFDCLCICEGSVGSREALFIHTQDHHDYERREEPTAEREDSKHVDNIPLSDDTSDESWLPGDSDDESSSGSFESSQDGDTISSDGDWDPDLQEALDIFSDLTDWNNVEFEEDVT
ncbi:hypothetical protein BDN72DRAFT_958993 [Pluteus cervinus]|uniref:Uncharacterized protein n=1 Tax=Pluteus cervinus TaxID=181527 RepID=A0ACD3AXU6_9AGAR|nr:hypothetical protein BDN72DRAFT_958993 [Pluteus cervinus]